MDQAIKVPEFFKVKCGFKTMKAPKEPGKPEVIWRKFREAVEVVAKFGMDECIVHERYEVAVKTLMAEKFKTLIQEKERAAAMIEKNPEYKHDMQAEADKINADVLLAYILDGSFDKDDVQGWWDSVAEKVRAYYKNAKKYDDVQLAKTCAYLFGRFKEVHNGTFGGTEDLQKSLVVVLERLEASPVQEYLLGKLKAKKIVPESEGLELIA